MLNLFQVGALPVKAEAEPSASQAYDQGLQQAKQQQKWVLLQFHADWCQDCKRMTAEMQSYSPVSHLLERSFVWVRVAQKGQRQVVYQGQQISEAELVKRLKVNAYPSLFFLRPDGSKLAEIQGYQSPQDLFQLLRFVSSGAYQKMRLEQFLRQ